MTKQSATSLFSKAHVMCTVWRTLTQHWLQFVPNHTVWNKALAKENYESVHKTHNAVLVFCLPFYGNRFNKWPVNRATTMVFETTNTFIHIHIERSTRTYLKAGAEKNDDIKFNPFNDVKCISPPFKLHTHRASRSVWIVKLPFQSRHNGEIWQLNEQTLNFTIK